VEHAGGRVADVFETVHDVARDEHNRAVTGRRGLAVDGQLIRSFENEEYLVPSVVDVVGRTVARPVPCHEDGDGPACGFGSEEDIHVEAERLDAWRLIGPDYLGL